MARKKFKPQDEKKEEGTEEITARVHEAAPLRCTGCGKLLAELVTLPWRIKCPRCGKYSVGV